MYRSATLLALAVAPLVFITSCGGNVEPELLELRDESARQRDVAHQLEQSSQKLLEQNKQSYDDVKKKLDEVHSLANTTTRDIQNLEETAGKTDESDLIRSGELDIFGTEEQREQRRREVVQSGLEKLVEEQARLEKELSETQTKLAQTRQLYTVLEEVRQYAQNAKEIRERLQTLSNKVRRHEQQQRLLESDVEAAGVHNWSVGKEVSLYLFGLKWLWGAFTGYAPTTSTYEQEQRLEKFLQNSSDLYESQKRELAQLEIDYQSALERLEQQSLARMDVLSSYDSRNALLGIRSQLLEAFSRLDTITMQHREVEDVYNLAIKVGVRSGDIKRPGAALDLSGGEEEQTTEDSSSLARAKNIYRVGGTLADEFKTFRKREYDHSLELLTKAEKHFNTVFSQLSETTLTILQPSTSTTTSPSSLIVDVRSRLGRQAAEIVNLKDSIKKTKESIEKYREEHASELGSFLAAGSPESETPEVTHTDDSDAMSPKEELAFFDSLVTLRRTVLLARDAYLDLLTFEQGQQRLVDKTKIYRRDYRRAYDNNWRIGREVALYLFGFKWVWGVLTGWAPTTSYAKEYSEYQAANTQLEESIASSEDALANIRDNIAHSTETAREAMDALLSLIRDPAQRVAVEAFRSEFNRSFDTLELAYQRYKVSYDLYTSSMDIASQSYSAYNMPVENAITDLPGKITEALGIKRSSPGVSVGWTLLEREREIEDYRRAEDEFFHTLERFRNTFSDYLETLLSRLSSQLTTTPPVVSTQDEATQEAELTEEQEVEEDRIEETEVAEEATLEDVTNPETITEEPTTILDETTPAEPGHTETVEPESSAAPAMTSPEEHHGDLHADSSSVSETTNGVEDMSSQDVHTHDHTHGHAHTHTQVEAVTATEQAVESPESSTHAEPSTTEPTESAVVTTETHSDEQSAGTSSSVEEPSSQETTTAESTPTVESTTSQEQQS